LTIQSGETAMEQLLADQPAFFTGDRKDVTDAVGNTWRTGDIYETSALVTVYGMFFFAVLALLRIAQQRTAAPTPATAVKATERAEPDELRPSV
jgi:hypothetical protein